MKLVGILNVTPDSMSDGGQYRMPAQALNYAACLIHSGAQVIDIGAESTRPGALPITHKEEWQRLSPVLEKILHKARSQSVQVSLDTRHPETMQYAVELGVDYINDVSGMQSQAIIDVVAHQSSLELVVMHSLSIPVDRGITVPESTDILIYMQEWVKKTLSRLEEQGIHRKRVILDPGLGFGKSPKQCWKIVQNLELLRKIHPRILIGHSRKTFLNPEVKPEARDRETLALSLLLMKQGVEFLRVHNIEEHQRVFKRAF